MFRHARRALHASLAAAFALTATATPCLAHGQEGAVAEDTDQVTAVLLEFRSRLGPILDLIGVSPESFDRTLAPLVRAAVPDAPPTGDWGFSMGFNFEGSSYSSPPDEGRQTVATDAAACAAAHPDAGPVIRHSVVQRDGLRGHQCVYLRPGEEGGAVLSSQFYIEGPDRHASLRFGAAGSTGPDQEKAMAMLTGVIDANLAVADALEDIVVEALLRQEVRAAQ